MFYELLLLLIEKLNICPLKAAGRKSEYEDSINSITSVDYLRLSINEIKNLKEKLNDIRNMVANTYADIISKQISCPIQ